MRRDVGWAEDASPALSQMLAISSDNWSSTMYGSYSTIAACSSLSTVRPEFDVLPLEATAAVAAAAPEEDEAVRLFVDMVVFRKSAVYAEAVNLVVGWWKRAPNGFGSWTVGD